MLELLVSLTAVGSIGFFILAAGVLGVMLWLTEQERFFLAVLMVIAIGLFGWFVYGWNPIGFVIAHPDWTILGLIGYFVIGTFWSIAKWAFWVQGLMDQSKKVIAEFKRTTPFEPGSQEYRDKLSYRLGQYLAYDAKLIDSMSDFPPNVGNNKSRIIFWIGFWPFSSLWTLIDEPVKRLTLFVYHRISGLLQTISDRIVFRATGL